MVIGYARVSTQDQNLNLQTKALTDAGCQKVFEDRVSGTRVERPGRALPGCVGAELAFHLRRRHPFIIVPCAVVGAHVFQAEPPVFSQIAS